LGTSATCRLACLVTWFGLCVPTNENNASTPFTFRLSLVYISTTEYYNDNRTGDDNDKQGDGIVVLLGGLSASRSAVDNREFQGCLMMRLTQNLNCK
jgi:hypothetical protein